MSVTRTCCLQVIEPKMKQIPVDKEKLRHYKVRTAHARLFLSPTLKGGVIPAIFGAKPSKRVKHVFVDKSSLGLLLDECHQFSVAIFSHKACDDHGVSVSQKLRSAPPSLSLFSIHSLSLSLLLGAVAEGNRRSADLQT